MGNFKPEKTEKEKEKDVVSQSNTTNFNPDPTGEGAKQEFNLPTPSYSDKNTVSNINLEDYKDYIPTGVYDNVGLDEARAQGQSNWERLGKASLNTLNELTLGTLHGISSIPDTFYNLYAISNDETKLFENKLSELLRETKEDINQSNEIYRERSSEGFSPAHASWWADNLPSIASAATFIIPTRAVGGAAGYAIKELGKVTRRASKLKGLKWMDELATAKGWNNQQIQQLTAIGAGTMYSNAAESFQDAVPLAMQKYEEAKQQGATEEEATAIASQVGRDIYTGNLVNAFLDIPSTIASLTPLKGTRNLLRARTKAGKLVSNPITGEIIPEGVQEAVNFISSEEASRKADQLIYEEGDSGNYYDRLIDDYLQNPELWTAAFFGSIGGGVFTGATAIRGRMSGEAKENKAKAQIQGQLLKEIAALKDDELIGQFADNKINFENSYQHSKAGTFGEYINLLDKFSKKSDEELNSLGISKDKIEEAKRQSLDIENRFIETELKYGSINPDRINPTDFNKELIWSELNRDRDIQALSNETINIDNLKTELINSISEENKEFAEQKITNDELNTRINHLTLQKARLLRNLNNIEKGKRKSTVKENKKILNSQINKIDSKIKSLKVLSKDIKNIKEGGEVKGLENNTKYQELQNAIIRKQELENSIPLHEERINNYSSLEYRRSKLSENIEENKKEVTDLEQKIQESTDVAHTQSLKESISEKSDLSNEQVNDLLNKIDDKEIEIRNPNVAEPLDVDERIQEEFRKSQESEPILSIGEEDFRKNDEIYLKGYGNAKFTIQGFDGEILLAKNKGTNTVRSIKDLSLISSKSFLVEGKEREDVGENQPNNIKKEILDSTDFFTRINLTLPQSAPQEGVQLIDKVLRQADWRNKIKLIGHRKFISSAKKFKGKHDKDRNVYIQPNKVVNMTIQVLNENNEWLDAGYIENPYKYVYVDSKGKENIIDFNLLTLEEVNNIFEIRDGKGISSITKEQLEELRTQQSKTISFLSRIDKLVPEGKKEIDISSFLDYNIFHASYNVLPQGKEISLDSFNLPVNDIVDTQNDISLLKGGNESVGLKERKLNSRYLANISLENGYSTYIPIRPKALPKNKYKETTDKINNVINELNRLTTRDNNTINKTQDLVKSIDLFIPPIDNISVQLLAQYSNNNNNYNLVLQYRSNGESLGAPVVRPLNNIEDLVNQIQIGLKKNTPNYKISKEYLRKSIALDKVPELVEFESLVGDNIFNTVGLRANFKTEEVEKQEDKLAGIKFISHSEQDSFSFVSANSKAEDFIDVQEEIKKAEESGEDTTTLKNKLNNIKNTPLSEEDYDMFKRSKSFPEEIINIKQAEKWLKSKLPEDIKINIENVFKYLPSQGITFGYFKDNVINLSKEAGKGTEYHEAFHAVFRALLTENEYRNYINKAKELYNISEEDILEISELSDKHNNLPYNVLEDIAYEEKLANEFENYMLGRESKSFLQTIFNKVKELINYILGNETEIDTLFKNINDGKFKNAKVNIKSHHIAKDIPAYKLLKGGITATESENLVNTITAKTINHLRNSNVTDINSVIDSVIETEFSNYNTVNFESESLKKKAVGYLIALSEPNNKNIIKSEVNSKLKAYNFNEIEQKIKNSDDDITFENFDVPITELGGFENVSKEIRQFLSLTLYKEELGEGVIVDKAIDVDSVHALFLRSLSGKKFKDQFKIIETLAKDDIQINAIYNKLLSEFPQLSDINNNDFNHPFLNRFEKTYERVPLKYIQVLQNPDDRTFTVLNANQKDIKNINFSRWKTDFDTNIQNVLNLKKSNKADSILENMISLRDIFRKPTKTIQDISKVKESLNSIGLNLSNGYLRYSLNIESDNKLIEGINKITTEDIDIITNIVLSRNNPYIGAKGRILNIAEGDSLFRNDLFESSYQDAQGNTRYGYVLPNHLIKKVKELNIEYGNNDNITNPYLKKNTLLSNKENIKDIFTNLEVVYSGDIREQSSQAVGKTYKNIDSRGFLLSQLGLYDKTRTIDGNTYAYYPSMILSDKSSSYSFLLPKNTNLYKDGITNEAIDIIYNNIFKQEFERLNGKYTDINNKIKNKTFVNLPNLNNQAVDSILGISREIKGDFNSNIKSISKEVSNPEVIRSYIKEGFETKIEEYLKALKDADIISNNNTNKLLPKNVTNVKDYIGNFILNSEINNIGISQLIQGDLSFAKDSVDRSKRNGGEGAYFNNYGEGEFKVEYIEADEKYINFQTGEESDTAKDGFIKIDKNDGQVYSTLKRKIHKLNVLGRITEDHKDYLEKMDLGLLEDSQVQTRGGFNIDLSPDKDVYYEGDIYHKMSIIPLTKYLTSYLPKSNKKRAIEIANIIRDYTKTNSKTGQTRIPELRKELENLWLPLKGKEELHNLRVYMDINGIDEMIPESASKIYNEKPIKKSKILEPDFINRTYKEKLRKNKYQGLQVENNSSFSNNNRVVDPTQLELLIDTELEGKAKFSYQGKDDYTAEELRDVYNNLLTERLTISLEKLFNQINIDSKGNRNIEFFISKIKDNLESTTPNPQLLEFLDSNGLGDLKYDTNLPNITKKFQQLFLAHFKNEGFSQKTPGYKMTLVSDSGYYILRDSGTVIDSETYKENPDEYKEAIPSKLKIHKSSEGTIEIAEVAMTRKQAELLGIKIGAVNKDLLEMIGTRIPTQTHHSMIPFKVVEFLPEIYGDSIIAPSEITYYSGSDYDIDKLFILRKDYYTKRGIQIPYGTAETIEDKFEEFISYEYKNNKDLKKKLSDKRFNSPTYQDILNSKNIENTNYEDITLDVFEILNPTNYVLSNQDFLLNNLENNFLKESLKELGLPSNIEDFTGSIYETNLGKINNSIFDIKMSILTNTNISESLFTPATTQGLKDDVESIYENFIEKDKTPGFHYTPTDIYKTWKNNATGKRNVGIVANINKIVAVLTKLKVTTNLNFTFDGNVYNTFDINKENDIIITKDKKLLHKKSIRRKADTISTLVSAMTDNGKDPMATKLNLTQDNLMEVGTLIGLGVGRTRTNLFINQPALRRLSEKLDNNNSEIAKNKVSKLKVLNNLIQESAKKAEITNIEEVSLEITSEEMLNNLQENDPLIDLKSLLLYKELTNISKDLNDVNSIISLNKGVSGDLKELTKVIEAVDRLEDVERKNTLENIKDKLFSYPQYNSQVKYIKKINDISKDFFIEKTDYFNKLYNRFSNRVTDKESFKERLKDGLLTFISVKGLEKSLKDRNINQSLANLNHLLYPIKNNETIAKEFLNNLKETDFNSNPFIRFLTPILKEEENNNTGYDYLEADSRIKMSNRYSEILIDGYLELFNNPKYKLFAQKLSRYLIVKDGLQFKSGSFVGYISPKIFKSISDKLKDFNSNINRDVESAFSRLGVNENEFLDLFETLFFEYEGNKDLLRKIPLNRLQQQNEITFDGKRMEVVIPQNLESNLPKYFILTQGFNAPEYLYKLTESKNNNKNLFYEMSSFKGNPQQSPYHNSIESFNEIKRLQKGERNIESNIDSNTEVAKEFKSFVIGFGKDSEFNVSSEDIEFLQKYSKDDFNNLKNPC